MCLLLMKYATWSLKLCPLIIIGIALLCLGGIFSVDFTTVIILCSFLYLM